MLKGNKMISQYLKSYGQRDALICLLGFIIFGFRVIYGRQDGKEGMALLPFLQTSCFYIVAIYLHNLVIIRLFDKKKYGWYCLASLGFTASWGFLNMRFLPEPSYADEPNLVFFDYASYVFLVQIMGFLLLSSYRYYTTQQNYLKNQVLLRDMELKTLKSQINPHFLFNAFNSLYGQIVEQTGDPANTVLKLSDLMHYQLSVHQKERMPLSDELQHLRNYIELEQMRWGDHLDIDFRIEGSTENLMIEPLLLLPFVENAFKHGVEGFNERAKVLINVAIQHQTLYLYIENDRPLNTPTPYKTSGTGLDNVKRRLDLAYPKNHDLHVDSSNPQRFCITLSIHLNPNY